MRKYNFIQDKRREIYDSYNEFTSLYEGDKYFSKKEYHYWRQKHQSIKSTINGYKLHIDRLKEYAKSFKVLNIIIDSYVNLFLVPKDYENIINYIHHVFETGIKIIITRNEAWVETELEKYKLFFDDQDNLSLTTNQRKTIVIDEANNLAVAGAGTGKTLTLVSKAGYILEKKLANPEEILILAYAREVKLELEERIKRNYDAEIDVRTYHSFGREIIGKSTGSKPLLSELSFDDDLLQKTLQGFLQTRMKDLKFTNVVNSYFVFYLNPIENDLDISTQSEYDEYLKSIQIRTLRGEIVKSLAELEIANFFYLNGINYEYEKEYVVKTSSETRIQYTPDFYLTDYNIWIEHIGIDSNCNTPPGVDRWEYLDSWYWKRKIHRENSTDLLETYSYQYTEGNLIKMLDAQLSVRDAEFSKIPEEQIYERLKSLGEVSQFVGLIKKFLKLYKSSTYTLSELREKTWAYPFAKRYLAFLDIFEPLLEDYQSILSETDRIDFDDMINNATDHIQKGGYKSPFKYILVDEFQDISQSRYRLLKSLTDQNWRTKTFCVGDDWQSIYRFTSSDLAIMTSFEKYFTPCEIMFLNETFRFNEKIADFSSKFIMKNPAQYEKTLVSRPSQDAAIKLIWYSDLNDGINIALEDIKKQAVGSEVFLLGRYNKQYYNDLDHKKYTKLKTGSQIKLIEEDNLDTKLFTIHSSKGKQADHVILFGLQSGTYGFPCGIEDDPILNLVLSEDDRYPNSEERRVFYVGVTRAKNTVYLLANRDRISLFVSEILSEEYEVTILGKSPILVTCPECGKGVINKIQWNDDVFFSCNRYPSCKYKPIKCSVCKEGFLYTESESDEYYNCSNEDCTYSPKKCPLCNGILVRRTGTPDFYGCSNYFSNNCTHKEELETLDEILDDSGA